MMRKKIMPALFDFEVNGRVFGYLNPYLIAEIGVNHEGSLERAKQMIDQVARAGGHAAKFQTYKAATLAAKTTSPAYWDQTKEATSSQYELFQRWDNFGPAEYAELAAHCESQGIDFLSTPFDLDAVDMLTPLMPVTKVASADLTNIPLLRKIGATGATVVMSCGASDLAEIARSLDVLLTAGAKSVTLLHCILNYPTPREHAQLAQIKVLQEQFGSRVAIGYSDHVRPEDDGALPTLEIASLFGARVIEKHFTDNKQGVGNDHYHAMDESDLRAFVDKLALYRTLYGKREHSLDAQSAAINNARRRVIAVRDLPVGHTVTADDLIALRSNIGIEIASWDQVVGRTVIAAIEADMPLEWHQLG
jgi:N-acetylneuraminate synthase